MTTNVFTVNDREPSGVNYSIVEDEVLINKLFSEEPIITGDQTVLQLRLHL